MSGIDGRGRSTHDHVSIWGMGGFYQLVLRHRVKVLQFNSRATGYVDDTK